MGAYEAISQIMMFVAKEKIEYLTLKEDIKEEINSLKVNLATLPAPAA